ncbi:MAG: IS3 family transposase [Bryobacteraceae bacterium]
MIARYRAEYPLTLMCRVLGIARSAFYAWQHRTPSVRAHTDAALRLRIAAAFARSGRTYGSPRIVRDLRAEHCRVSRRRVARLMGELGLDGTPTPRFVVTTRTEASLPVAPNLLARAFAVETPNRVWAADATYCRTDEGWLYLAVVLDLCSRRVVGWATRPQLDTPLVRAALDRALAVRQPAPGLVHHSDRGSTYASGDYRARLAERGIVCSMSRRGDCWDNAVVESFFATLKRECIRPHRWPTRASLLRALARYLDGWYNRERRHSSLDYLSPMVYEQQLMRAA